MGAAPPSALVRRGDAGSGVAHARRAAPLTPDRLRSGQFDARIGRARSLALAHPASSEPLTFYANLVELQQRIVEGHQHVVRSASTFAESIDFEAAADAMPTLLAGLLPIAPEPIVVAAERLLHEGHAGWRHLAHTYWGGARDEDPLRAFIAEALLQPFAEVVAASGVTRSAGDGDAAPSCPVCGDKPLVAVLREAAHSARRSLVCGFCLTEWPAPRIACVSCGERQFDKLAIYRAEQLAAARVDACETCRRYIKTIDLAKDATAVPVVDDLATVTLDLWAREQGYQRLRQNLLRF